MTMQIAFEMSDHDLQHFELIMHAARKAAASASPELVVAGAEKLLLKISGAQVPELILQKLEKLRIMITMLADPEWRLPQQDAARVLNALAYFCEPEDLIPDHIPGLGFLDDAIMIELVAIELRHEIQAYEDFCEYRSSMPPKASVKVRTGSVTREDWLENHRNELQSRMRHRRDQRGRR